MSLNAYNIPLFFAKRKAWQKKWDNGCLKKAIVSKEKSLAKEMRQRLFEKSYCLSKEKLGKRNGTTVVCKKPLFLKRKAWQKKRDKCHLPKFFDYQIKEKAITIVIAFCYLFL